MAVVYLPQKHSFITGLLRKWHSMVKALCNGPSAVSVSSLELSTMLSNLAVVPESDWVNYCCDASALQRDHDTRL